MVFWVGNATNVNVFVKPKEQETLKAEDTKTKPTAPPRPRHQYGTRYKTKMDAARQLLSDILNPRRYDPNIRPVLEYDQPVKVTIGLNLYQILNVNERDENVLLYMWTRQLWDDAYLGWDPDEYRGINWTTLPWRRLWIPDTCVYNSIVTKETFINMMATTSAIDPNATKPYVAHIRFMYPALYKFSCNLDVKYFPFDRQNCSMVFGSWTLDGAAIDYRLHMDTVRFEYYVSNEEWSVISFKMVRRENWYTCCPYPYTELHAHLIIQRKPLYYIVNLIVPIIIIAVIAAFGFFTPVSSGGERTERVELGVNTLLAMSILLVIVADQMPTTSNSVPLISWFYVVNIILIAVGTVLASVVMIIQQQGYYGRQLPESVKKVFFGFVGPLLCIYPLHLRKKRARYNFFQTPSNSDNGEDDTKPLIQRGLKQASQNAVSIGTPLKKDEKQDVALLREVRNIKTILYTFQQTQDIHDYDSAIKVEWEYLAVILDRALLLIFMGLLVTVVAVFFSFGFSLLNHEDDPATIHCRLDSRGGRRLRRDSQS